MKENHKTVEDLLKGKKLKVTSKNLNKILNLALQRVDSDDYYFDGKAFYTADKQLLIYFLGNNAEYTLPAEVRQVGEMAFYGNKKLEKITFNNGLETIDKNAFFDCDALTDVTIPESVDHIAAYAFADCDKLHRVIFNRIPEHLSKHAFDDSLALSYFKVPAGGAKKLIKELHISDDADILIDEPLADIATKAVEPEQPKEAKEEEKTDKAVKGKAADKEQKTDKKDNKEEQGKKDKKGKNKKDSKANKAKDKNKKDNSAE